MSGGTMIGVQTTGVMHKKIKIPEKVPKNGKLLFFVLCNMALIFFCIKIFLFYYFFLVKLVVAKMIVSYNHHPHFIALSARDTAIKSVSILFGQRACPASTSTTATLMSCIIMKYQIRTYWQKQLLHMKPKEIIFPVLPKWQPWLLTITQVVQVALLFLKWRPWLLRIQRTSNHVQYA
jgi:hypothetical protein